MKNGALAKTIELFNHISAQLELHRLRRQTSQLLVGTTLPMVQY